MAISKLVCTICTVVLFGAALAGLMIRGERPASSESLPCQFAGQRFYNGVATFGFPWRINVGALSPIAASVPN
jgi:hypothetical protein